MSKEEQGVLQKTRNQTNKLKAPWANCLTALKIAPKVFRCNCLYFIYKTIRKARKPTNGTCLHYEVTSKKENLLPSSG